MAAMRLCMWALGLCAASVITSIVAFAQPASSAISLDLAAAVAELERDRSVAIARIQECDATIDKSQAIIFAARAKGNAQAEQIASAALKKAEDAKAKNEGIVRMIDGTLKNFKSTSGTPKSLSAEERALAKSRMIELKKDIAKIQESLRACIDSTTKTLAEREALEKQITAAYDKSWMALREGLMDLGTIGLSKLYALRGTNINENLEKARKTMRETNDPNRKAQLLAAIEWLQREDKLTKYNSALVQRASELKLSRDVYEWDKKEAPFPEKLAGGMDLMAGMVSSYYTPAKMSYIGLSSLNAELSAWHRLREIDKENAGCSAEAESLSFRMEQKMHEAGCLDSCLDNPARGCADKCRGKTAH